MKYQSYIIASCKRHGPGRSHARKLKTLKKGLQKTDPSSFYHGYCMSLVFWFHRCGITVRPMTVLSLHLDGELKTTSKWADAFDFSGDLPAMISGETGLFLGLAHLIWYLMMQYISSNHIMLIRFSIAFHIVLIVENMEVLLTGPRTFLETFTVVYLGGLAILRMDKPYLYNQQS